MSTLQLRIPHTLCPLKIVLHLLARATGGWSCPCCHRPIGLCCGVGCGVGPCCCCAICARGGSAVGRHQRPRGRSLVRRRMGACGHWNCSSLGAHCLCPMRYPPSRLPSKFSDNLRHLRRTRTHIRHHLYNSRMDQLLILQELIDCPLSKLSVHLLVDLPDLGDGGGKVPAGQDGCHGHEEVGRQVAAVDDSAHAQPDLL
mmetsp:Transcript_4499/g.10511  ORF Transcript_4499/g.10511 Transcript_4499/m.10511 type:complete len:200 (+) Transcript_4499:1036-1635(+)